MRLLHVIASMNPRKGGPAEGVKNLHTGLVKLGVEIEVVCLDDPKAEFLVDIEINIHAVGPAKGLWQYSSKLLPWLEANLQRFDAVIINGLWLYNSYAVLRAFKSLKLTKPTRKILLFVMPHGMLDPYFQNAKERRLKAIRNRIYWNLIEKEVVNTADGLLFTCETELLLARTTFGSYHPKNELNIGYGIQSPPDYNIRMDKAFAVACPGLNNKPYLLFLSRIHSKKGVDLLVNAYITIFESAPSETLPKLVIVGPGMDTWFGQDIVKLVKASKAAENIFFPGMLIDDAKWGAFYNCDAFILPSHQENFGIAVVEALACGKPVLISNKVNIFREILKDEVGLVEEDNLSGTEALLRRWTEMDDLEKLKMIGSTKIAYQNNFTANAATKKLLRVIQQI